MCNVNKWIVFTWSRNWLNVFACHSNQCDIIHKSVDTTVTPTVWSLIFVDGVAVLFFFISISLFCLSWFVVHSSVRWYVLTFIHSFVRSFVCLLVAIVVVIFIVTILLLRLFFCFVLLELLLLLLFFSLYKCKSFERKTIVCVCVCAVCCKQYGFVLHCK